jgi:hypothetical protein
VETGSAMWPSLQKVPVELPNDWRISCGPSCARPHQLWFRSVLAGRCARAKSGTFPARRLHARVRRHRPGDLPRSSLASGDLVR